MNIISIRQLYQISIIFIRDAMIFYIFLLRGCVGVGWVAADREMDALFLHLIYEVLIYLLYTYKNTKYNEHQSSHFMNSSI